MPIIHSDQISEANPIYVLLLMISSIGIFDISREIIDDNKHVFSKNFMKKIMLFSFLYIKTKSISQASLLSVMIFILFKKVFFGETTYKK